MDKIDVIQKLKCEQLISVVRMETKDSKEAIEAVIEGGVHFIEITLTMDNALDLISYFTKKYEHQDIIIGAGTVLDTISARLAILNGAKFLVAPSFNKDIATLCNLYRIPYIPGVHNPQDIETALCSGVDILKLFPASTLEPFIIKEFKGPFPQANFIISGKVNKENMQDWLRNGATAVCLGSALTNKIAEGKNAVIDVTKSFVSMLHE